jgi:hypothetical protein
MKIKSEQRAIGIEKITGYQLPNKFMNHWVGFVYFNLLNFQIAFSLENFHLRCDW